MVRAAIFSGAEGLTGISRFVARPVRAFLTDRRVLNAINIAIIL
jgi:hypothetical protein